MTKHWNLEPEVAGELGAGSMLDLSVHPPRVSKLEYIIKGWLGDDLLETFPCYIVTTPLAQSLVAAQLSGLHLDNISIVISDEFRELYPNRRIPDFRWLRVV